MKKITLLMLIILITITSQAQNKLLSSIRENFSNNTWQKTNGENYEYDSKNNLIIETFLDWDSNTATWLINGKSTYTYNAANKVTEEVYQNLNTENNTLENEYKLVNTYEAGKITEITDYFWENANWVVFTKLLITYNSNNLPISYISNVQGDTQLEPEERYTVTYNTNNKIASSTSEAWESSNWVNSEKQLYTYNAQNKIISQIGAKWDKFNNNWSANGYKTEYTWDATGNKTQKIDYQGDSMLNTRIYKDEYTYDTFNLMSSFAHPFKDKTGVDYLFEDFPYINKVQVENNYYYQNTTNSYEINSRTTYNYNTAITLSTPTIEKITTHITVNPNPTRDFLDIQNPSKINIDKIYVTDVTGKKVLEQNNAKQVDVRNLAKGMYFLQALSGKNKLNTKFIKE